MKRELRSIITFVCFLFLLTSVGPWLSGQVNLSNSPGKDSWSPRIAVDSQGNIHVVWAEYVPGTQNGDAYYSKYNIASKVWSTPINLSNSGRVWSGEYRPVGIALDGIDSVYVLYVEKTRISLRIFSGGSWGVPMIIHSWATGNCDSARIAVDANANIFTTWWTTDSYKVHTKARIGGTWEDVKSVSTGQGKFPDIAVGNNVAFATWTQKTQVGSEFIYQIFYTKRNKSLGANWDVAKLMYQGSVKQQVPAIEIDSNDVAHIVFTPLVALGGIRVVRHCRWTGSGFAAPQDVSSSGLLHYPALDERGNNLYCAWQVGAYGDGLSVDHNQRIGGSWQAEGSVPDSNGATYCDVASSPSQDTVYYVWDGAGEIWCNMSEQVVVHVVSTPTTPAGPSEGAIGGSYGFTTGGSACNLGHAVEYRFDWGDKTMSVWTSSPALSHAWSTADAYEVKAQARCAVEPTVVSDWSAAKLVVISAAAGPYTLEILPASGGTTSPAPGSYPYGAGAQAYVEASPNPGYRFSYWEGNVPESGIGQNPLSLTMDGDKVIRPHFLMTSWSVPSVNLSQTVAMSTAPRLAASGSSLHALWIEGGLLYYRRSPNGGASWGSKVQLTNGGDISEESYGISIAASGDYVHILMSWRYLSSDDHDIYYLRSTDGGASFGSWVQLTNDDFETRIPDIAVFGSDVHIVYTDLSMGNWEVMYLKIQDYGTGATTSRRVSFTDTGISFKPQIAVSLDGTLVHIVYTDTYSGTSDIYYARLAGAGTGALSLRKLTAGGGASRYPDIAVSQSGDLQYVFISYISDALGNDEVFMKRLAEFGLGEEKTIRLSYSSGASVFPRIATAGEDVYVVHADLTPGHWVVYSKKIPNYGLAHFLTNQVSYGMGNSELPDVVCLNGKAHTVWSDDSTGNYEILYKSEI
jgi:hypothetical protein